MIDTYSLDTQLEKPNWPPTNVGCLNFGYSKASIQLIDNNGKKWTKEDKKNPTPSYFKSNPAQRKYRKKRIEIREESAKDLLTKLQ